MGELHYLHRVVEKSPWERPEAYRPDLYASLADDRHERRIDYAYMVAGALCAVAGLGLAWIGGLL